MAHHTQPCDSHPGLTQAGSQGADDQVAFIQRHVALAFTVDDDVQAGIDGDDLDGVVQPDRQAQ